MEHRHPDASATLGGSFATYGLDASAPLRVKVANDAGSVKVTAVDRPDLLVRSSLPEVDGAPRPTGLRVVVSGQSVTVDPDEAFRRQPVHGTPQGIWAGMLNDLLQMPFHHRGDAVDIEVEVPLASPGVTLTVTAASGDLEVAGVRGPVAVRTASGDIRVRDTVGALRVETASGDLAATHHHGGLHVATASGDVRVDTSQIDKFTCNTANGDVLLDRVGLGPVVHMLNTVSGDVTLTLLPSAPGASSEPVGVAFGTVSGDVRLGPGFARLNGRAIEQAGTGRTVLRVRTVGGDLSARMADLPTPDPLPHAALTTVASALNPDRERTSAAPPAIEQVPFGSDVPDTPPAAATVAAPEVPTREPLDRLTVLRQLQEGLIGIDEAMRVLDDLDAADR